MQTIRICIVGAGGMGRVHYANYRHVEGTKVIGVCDLPERAKAAAEEWGAAAFSSITEMAAALKPDVIDICTPTFCHHDQVMESLNLGIPTIVEKPVALCYAHAQEMFAEAKLRGVPLFVAQVLQFTKEVEALKQTVASGRYGAPIDAHFERLSQCPGWVAGGWLFDRSKSGLLPYDLHIHDLDVIVSVFGMPKGHSVSVTRGKKSFPEHIRCTYSYPGLNVVGEAAWFNACIPFTARWRVAFEEGMLVNEGGSLKGYSANGEVTDYPIQDEVTVSTGINVPPCGWYYNELKHFMDCIRKGESSHRVPEEQILNVMRLLEEISRECE